MQSTPTLRAAEHLIPSLLDDLRSIVDIDSGSYTPDGIAAVADYLEPRIAALGATVERVDGGALGPSLVARFSGSGQGQMLLIGHMDTVFPAGEVAERPFRVADGRAYGPGVLDMKSGLLVALYALQLLHEAGETPFATLTFILNSDEEIGSPASRELIRAGAQSADVALVLEPTADVERLTVARKGVGMYRLVIEGVSAHAGVEPTKGRSAILELAHKIVAVHALNGSLDGLTLNVGVVAGGERPNVVADHA